MDLKGFKTFLGIIIATLPQLAQSLGFSISGEDHALFTETVDAGFVLAGGVLAVYGRWKADTPIFRKR